MIIFIPTLNRRSSDTLLSLNVIRDNYKIFMVCSNEADLRYWSDKSFAVYGPMGIANIRQWCIHTCRQQGDEKCLMMDDDLVFATRRDDEPTKFRPSTTDEIVHMLSDIEHLLDSYAHVGVSTREGGNRDVDKYVTNTRLLRVLGYRCDVFTTNLIRFNRIELMEDFDVTLQLLEDGYQNIRLNWIVHNQRSSNAPGGCSTYRTLERQAAAAKALKELHPHFVETVIKKTKTAWNGKERTDVRIQWLKAFNSARKVLVLDQPAGVNKT